MAEVDVASVSCRPGERPIVDVRQLPDDSSKRHAGFPGRPQGQRNVEVGSDTDSGRCIVEPDVREEEEHEQGPVAGPEVHMELVAHLVAAVDVPAGVAGVFGAGEPNRERAHVGSREPASGSDELIEGRA